MSPAVSRHHVRSSTPMQASTRRVAVIGGNRIPFARSNGAYADASNQDMLTAAIDGLVTRYGLEGERLGEVVAGAVLKHSRNFNLTREAVLGSPLAAETPAYDLQQACDTGIQATIAVDDKIALGQIEVGIAGGTDSTSDAPIAVNENLRKILLEANRAKSLQGRLAALAKARPQYPIPATPQNREPRTGLSMGESAARTALEWDISREEQDKLAVARTRTSPRRTTVASSTISSRLSKGSRGTRTCARTPRWTSSRS